MKIRRMLAAGVATVALVGVSACGSEKSGTDADGTNQGSVAGSGLTAANFASDVSSAQEQAQSVRMTGDFSFQGQSVTLEAEAAGLDDPKTVEAQMTMSGDALQGAEVDMVLSDQIVYFKGLPIPGTDPAKPWTKIDLSDPSNPVGQMFSASTNPAQISQWASGATEVEEVGSETVNGVEATKYNVTIDTAKALENSGTDVDASTAGLPGELVVQMWIGEGNLPVQITSDLGGQGSMKLVFSDWGGDVNVEVPPADQVTEL